MKSVLLTGATGFIGQHTVSSLLDRNFKIHACFSQEKPVTKYNDITWHAINLHDHQAVEKLLQQTKPTHLLHLERA